MKKEIELLMAKQFAELAVCNLDAVMKDDSLSDKEYNNIREAHDSIASARDAIVRLTKPQRMVSAEAKETGYGGSDDEEIVKLADEYYDKVLIKECDMEEKDAHHCRIAYIHGAKAMLDWLRCIKQRNTWKPSEEQMEALWCAAEKYLESDNANVVELRGKVLESLYNDLNKLTE